MTRPSTHRFHDSRKPYSLAEKRGTGLFNPKAYGMKLTPPHTACWRGSVAHYEVRNDRLRLNAVCLWSSEVETLPLLLYGAPLRLREGEVPDPLYGRYVYLFSRERGSGEAKNPGIGPGCMCGPQEPATRSQ